MNETRVCSIAALLIVAVCLAAATAMACTISRARWHEMGHAAGLGHSTSASGGLMYKGYLRADLADNDVNAIKSIYEDEHEHDE